MFTGILLQEFWVFSRSPVALRPSALEKCLKFVLLSELQTGSSTGLGLHVAGESHAQNVARKSWGFPDGSRQVWPSGQRQICFSARSAVPLAYLFLKPVAQAKS